jgi:hypothetical protein
MNKSRTISEISKIVEALGKHSDNSAVAVLEEIGTNSSDDLVRELTANALINRNTNDSLRIILINKGKGIHDMSPSVADAAINGLKALTDKSEAVKILDETISSENEESVITMAKAVKEIISQN